MISFLKGKIIFKKDKYIVLKTGDFGFKVFMSKKSLENLETGKEIEIFTNLIVRENVLDLYGFKTQGELDFFEILEEIRGIGPKAALEISSLGPLEKIKDRILNQDEKLFESIPGIGRKKAMSIIMELTGKIKVVTSPKADEAESALIGLGFTKQQAKEAINSVPKEIINIEERIKYALKRIKH